MADADVFGTTRVELINGRIYRIAPRRNPHMVAISKSTQALSRAQGPNDWIIIQGTLQLDRFSAPDPDLLWLPVPIGTPEHEWPAPILLIEISHTSYRKDSGIKLRKYAQSRIPDYWILNLAADRVEVYRDPLGGGRLSDCSYNSVSHFTRGKSISPLARPQVEFKVNDLLP